MQTERSVGDVVERLDGSARHARCAGSFDTARIPYRAITQAINVIIYIERVWTGHRVKTGSRIVGRQWESYPLKAVSLPT